MQDPAPGPAPSAATPFHPAKLAEMDAVIHRAIADKKCPGGVLWLEHRGASYHKAYGNRALVPAVEPMTEDTIFDAASLTKVIACTPAVMLLVERGQVELDERVQTYIPEFKRRRQRSHYRAPTDAAHSRACAGTSRRRPIGTGSKPPFRRRAPRSC